MATRKKAGKSKQTKAKQTKAKKSTRAKSVTRKKKVGGKTASKRKLQPKKKAAARKVPAKVAQKQVREPEPLESLVNAPPRSSRSGRQSGDLQGITRRHRADSESADELLEEGNSFEAGVISGVEEAGDDEAKEVRTRQVPEDDVPGEYLDED
jgi:hypothetical protein